MFNVYYCIKYLNEKESINLVHILIWPFASIYSIIQLTKKLSGKYTDLMIDVYGDKKLIEDKKSKKKDKDLKEALKTLKDAGYSVINECGVDCELESE